MHRSNSRRLMRSFLIGIKYDLLVALGRLLIAARRGQQWRERASPLDKAIIVSLGLLIVVLLANSLAKTHL